jgi:hypothetical protein
MRNILLTILSPAIVVMHGIARFCEILQDIAEVTVDTGYYLMQKILCRLLSDKLKVNKTYYILPEEGQINGGLVISILEIIFYDGEKLYVGSVLVGNDCFGRGEHVWIYHDRLNQMFFVEKDTQLAIL